MKDEFRADKIGEYFRAEWAALVIITISGLIYNIGLMEVTIFEGKLAQCLYDVLGERKTIADMVVVAIYYVAVVALIQISRYIKRFYVRRFGNNTNRRMKQALYKSLVNKPKCELEKESAGSMITKAISDVDDCVEGMRKFTTEIYDTGVLLIGYIGMLMYYDWKLALLSLVFPPIAYIMAEKMKVHVQKMGAAYKESAARLSAVTMDRVGNGITYRVYGCEKERNAAYEEVLGDYERAAVRSQILGSALQPIYNVISMISAVFILILGGRNVANHVWDIGVFTAYLSCYTKLAIKSSKSAKLFNAVHKAQVSWLRIHPLMCDMPAQVVNEEKEYALRQNSKDISKELLKEKTLKQMHSKDTECKKLYVKNLGVQGVFSGLSFETAPGQIIGVTGAVASGKSVFGKTFLQEEIYEGDIIFGAEKLISRGNVCYLGHSLELFSDTIENNILLGKEDDAWRYLKAVELDKEVEAMPEGIHTRIGTGGLLLSGGQKQRLALARILANAKPIIILDDPFSALDKQTELKVYNNIFKYINNDIIGDSAQSKNCFNDFVEKKIVFIISHRLYLFPEFDKVIWMENGQAQVSQHIELFKNNPSYRELYRLQVSEGEER